MLSEGRRGVDESFELYEGEKCPSDAPVEALSRSSKCRVTKNINF